eukprot:COSAG02_NODE_32496_length_515_cov_0.865385_1_plen_25_part_10
MKHSLERYENWIEFRSAFTHGIEVC